MSDKPELNETDGMLLTIEVIEAFAELPWNELPADSQRGAMLLFERVLRRGVEKLPAAPQLDYLRVEYAKAKMATDLIRRRFGIEPQ
jgi:hypothetical protein